ncbi:MAG: HPr family phosphocarrier protein [Eubacteriales bacterium]|nr:HPr family phosphocarrier protein [Eubacteriales bacterium]
MTKNEVIITNETGLHARPAANLVGLCKKFKSKITITNSSNNQNCNAKSILSVLAGGFSKGVNICIEADGEDEQIAINEVSTYIKELVE